MAGFVLLEGVEFSLIDPERLGRFLQSRWGGRYSAANFFLRPDAAALKFTGTGPIEDEAVFAAIDQYYQELGCPVGEWGPFARTATVPKSQTVLVINVTNKTLWRPALSLIIGICPHEPDLYSWDG